MNRFKSDFPPNASIKHKAQRDKTHSKTIIITCYCCKEELNHILQTRDAVVINMEFMRYTCD